MIMMNEQANVGIENGEFRTEFLKDQIERCEDVEELISCVLPMIKTQQDQWSIKFNQILQENGYKKTEFAAMCDVSRVTVDKWCKGAIPKNRETFIKIGLAAGYNLEQMDVFLNKYGQYPGLYSKNLDDCVCMYVLKKAKGKEALEQYIDIRDKICADFKMEKSEESKNITTARFDAKLSAVDNQDELEEFIVSNRAVFSLAYRKLYSTIKASISENYQGEAGSDYEFAEAQGWTSSLRQSVSAIRQNKWKPTRNKIISLGLHLGLDQEQIDDLLMLAHMEPLYAKNIFESVIIFILNDAELNDILNSDDPDGLCKHAKKILVELNLPELESFLAEVAEIDNE